MRVRGGLAYDGTDFRGFAAQRDDVRTVAGVLAETLAKVLRVPVRIECAGRTDAGVHAIGQVVAFDAPDDADLVRAQRAVNAMLGGEVVLTSLEACDATFDPRRDAVSRRYRYTLNTAPTIDPFSRRYAWWVEGPLDLNAMRIASDALIGEHDFASFCRKGPEGTTTVRRVLSADWFEPEAGVLHFEIVGAAFCWQMVRSIVGTLVAVGEGKRKAGEMLHTIRAADRDAAGPVAPPHGLCLMSVDY